MKIQVEELFNKLFNVHIGELMKEGNNVKLTHIDEKGTVVMVDVGDKEKTERKAEAQAVVIMKSDTVNLIMSDNIKKGNVLATAKIAAIMAAKCTYSIIPLCHNIELSKIEINIEKKDENKLIITSFVKCKGTTGVEMEALVAVTVAALTIYDMCKAVDRGINIDNIHLCKKSGGKSGVYIQKPIIEDILLKPSKEKRILSLQRCTIYEDGIEGYTKGDKAISLVDASIYDENIENEVKGICFNKFYGNLVIRNMNFDELKVGDILEIGSVKIEITQVGKQCFKECNLVRKGIECRLKTSCAFARVLEQGNIFVGDVINKVILN